MSIRLAVVQMAVGTNEDENLEKAGRFVVAAAEQGARIVLLQELFAAPYFCKDQDPKWFHQAHSAEDHPVLGYMRGLARKHRLVLPVSFFERAGNAFFNCVTVFDADGADLGFYRKSHIPDGPGYQEKFYFSPGDTGLKVFNTCYGRVGVAICWDQWFPEVARILALRGAELILYPSAIGSEPTAPELDTRPHWTRTMQGHAAANMVPVAAANRVGREVGRDATVTFYGGSFVADPTGDLIAQAGTEEGVIYADLDLQAFADQRAAWGLFRDRRPDLYAALLTYDGGR